MALFIGQSGVIYRAGTVHKGVCGVLYTGLLASAAPTGANKSNDIARSFRKSGNGAWVACTFFVSTCRLLLVMERDVEVRKTVARGNPGIRSRQYDLRFSGREEPNLVTSEANPTNVAQAFHVRLLVLLSYFFFGGGGFTHVLGNFFILHAWGVLERCVDQLSEALPGVFPGFQSV